MNLIDRVKNVIEKILPKKKPEIAQDATSEPVSLSSSPSISLADDSISPLVPQAPSTAVPIIIRHYPKPIDIIQSMIIMFY